MASVTQSRLWPQPAYVGWDSVYQGATTPRSELFVPGVSGCIQVTTSYRTGRGAEGGTSVEEDSDTALLTATNYRDRFKVMKEELRREPKSALDNGHEFNTKMASIPYCSQIATGWIPQGVGTWVAYNGPIWPGVWPSGTLPNGTFKYMDPPDLGWYGPRAISATTPTNPSADVATALTELYREGFPSMPSSTIRKEARAESKRQGNLSTGRRASGAAGSEYLNVEFGWRPLVRDLRRVASAVKDSQRILKQHKRNSGKSIRRQYTFPLETTFTKEPDVLGILMSSSGSTAWRSSFEGENCSGQMSETIETEREVYFSGAYTYSVGIDGDSPMGPVERFEQKANLLLGTRITPEVVWNVAPWSWLADWRVNIGENISNATALASDGLVMRYGYLMVKSTVRHTYTLLGPRHINLSTGVSTRVPYSISFVTVTKERMRASPFGFGSNPASFTGRQWAILASLGMTKGDRALRLND